LSSNLCCFKFRFSLDSLLFSLGAFFNLTYCLGTFSLNDFEVSVYKCQLSVEIFIELKPLLLSGLLYDFEFFVIVQHPHFILLLGSLEFIHGTVLGFLIQGLSDVCRQSHVLYNDSSELKTFVLKHLIQKLQHLMCAFPTFDLIYL